MEENRLKGMPQGYDQKLFDKLYKELTPLKNSLVYSINARKFGVEPNDIASWMDIKFIHVFCKYYSDPRLKGYLINSLSMYKTHIIQLSYHPNKELYTQSHSWEDLGEAFHESIPDEAPKEAKPEYDMAMAYFKQKLSSNAFLILELELSPPSFFNDRKFNTENILAFFELEDTSKNVNFINGIRSEIKQAIKSAKLHFSTQPL